MDNISADEKEKRISFSDAMTSIEGVPVSDKVKTDLANWKKGNITFLSVFEQTLRRYGFVTEVYNASPRLVLEVVLLKTQQLISK